MKLSLLSPIPDPTSDYLIVMSHESLTISHDFEMTQKVRMEYFTKDGEEIGIPLLESIRINPNLTDDQKARMANQWKPFFREVSTSGNFVDAITLELVEAVGGVPPEGAIPEKMAWLNVLASQAPGNKLSDKVKAMLVQSMSKMVERKRI